MELGVPECDAVGEPVLVTDTALQEPTRHSSTTDAKVKPVMSATKRLVGMVEGVWRGEM